MLALDENFLRRPFHFPSYISSEGILEAFMAEFDIGPSARPLLDHENTTIYLDVDEEDNGSTDVDDSPLLLETEYSVYIDAQEDVQNGVDPLNHQRVIIYLFIYCTAKFSVPFSSFLQLIVVVSEQDMVVERIFLIANFVVELPSAVFDQLSSVHKPQFALISMVMSLAAMLLSIIDLADKGRRERVEWMVRDHLPWFYSPQINYKPLGTFSDIVGLVCSIFQWVFATIAYVFLSHHSDNPNKFSVWPIIFAFGALCSRFPRNPRTVDAVHESTETHRSRPGSPSPSPLKDLRDLQLLELVHLPIPSRVECFHLREYICSDEVTTRRKKVGRNGRKNRRRRRSRVEREIIEMTECEHIRPFTQVLLPSR